MKQTEIVEKINGFLVEEFEVDPAKITPDANLKDTLELDSLDYIDLVVVVEKQSWLQSKTRRFYWHRYFSGFL